MVGVFDEPAIIAHFIHGVEHSVMYVLQEQLNEEPNLSYQAIATGAQNYWDADRGKRPTEDQPPPRRSRTSAALLAFDPTGEARGYPFSELELGTVFQAEALAVAQFSRTASSLRIGAPLRSMDDGSNLPVVAAIRAPSTVVMRACDWVNFCTSALGFRKSFVSGFVKRERRGPRAGQNTR